eukprot:272087_1
MLAMDAFRSLYNGISQHGILAACLYYIYIRTSIYIQIRCSVTSIIHHTFSRNDSNQTTDPIISTADVVVPPPEPSDAVPVCNGNRSHSPFNCHFCIWHNTYAFNLFDSYQRHHAMRYLMKVIWIQPHSINIGIRTCTVFSPEQHHIQANMFCFELIRQHEVVASTLESIHQSMITSKYEFHHGLRNIFDVLIYNRLILKYIFQSPKGCGIWQPLMMSVFYILSFHVPLLTSTMTQHIWLELFSDFILTIKYWKYEHLMYFMDSGGCVAIYNIFARFVSIRKPTEDPPALTLWASFRLYAQIKKLSKRLDSLHGTECTKYLKQEMETYLPVGAPFYALQKKASRDVPSATNLTFYSRDRRCGWPMCYQTASSFDQKNKCKGCRLIQYCCRNHQKKHWKLIHSQQCGLFTM